MHVELSGHREFSSTTLDRRLLAGGGSGGEQTHFIFDVKDDGRAVRGPTVHKELPESDAVSLQKSFDAVGGVYQSRSFFDHQEQRYPTRQRSNELPERLNRVTERPGMRPAVLALAERCCVHELGDEAQIRIGLENEEFPRMSHGLCYLSKCLS